MYDHFHFLIYFNLRWGGEEGEEDRKVNVYRSKSQHISKSVGVAEMCLQAFQVFLKKQLSSLPAHLSVIVKAFF